MNTSLMRQRLSAIARNYSWTWSPEAQELLGAIPTAAPAKHPFKAVSELNEAQLAGLGEEPGFEEAAERLGKAADTNVANADINIAYFSPEFGITEVVPQYSGGLGILAGDHLKAASDLSLPLAGVGLFYSQGFFRQDIKDGEQSERYETCYPDNYGLRDTGIKVDVPIQDRTVIARVWLQTVGSIPLLLLDTNLEANSSEDRHITDRLYSGDRQHRIQQEMILGVGGARAVTAMGYEPKVHHLNEGHAGFLILELIDREISAGKTLKEAIAHIGPGLVFTTHTPVPAGIDRFDPDMAASHLQPWADRWNLPVADLLELGSEAPSSETPTTPGGDRLETKPKLESLFNMAYFALRIADRANGVSRLHGEVSRNLFADVERGPDIGHITNGVHARTWVAPALQSVFDDRLGDGWEIADGSVWEKVSGISDDEIRQIRTSGKEDLARLVKERVGIGLDPSALTIGFARRFATYKRANLLLRHMSQLAELLANDGQPVQFVFAGKAHPADTPGKQLIREIVEFSGSSEANGRFVLIPDYEIAVAQSMYAGCDVWLNTPIRPREASGTSGEKSALNGGLNFSIHDGWWAEMADDRNGWTIPSSPVEDPDARDHEEADSIFRLLTEEIIPLYYADGDIRPSSAWLERVRDCWTSLGPKVTASRMVSDYRDQLYNPAAADSNQ